MGQETKEDGDRVRNFVKLLFLDGIRQRQAEEILQESAALFAQEDHEHAQDGAPDERVGESPSDVRPRPQRADRDNEFHVAAAHHAKQVEGKAESKSADDGNGNLRSGRGSEEREGRPEGHDEDRGDKGIVDLARSKIIDHARSDQEQR